MIVVDVNVLVYASNRSSPRHDAAQSWLTGVLRGTEPLGFSWTTVLGFVRLCTGRHALERPLTPDEACGLVEIWLGAPPSRIIEPGPRHLVTLRSLLREAGTAGNLTSDAHLAALALENGAAVATFDRDFERFGVRVVVPGS